jgi:hypothetical protein
MDTQDTNTKTTLKSFLADGGWKSRKLWLSVFCLILLSAFVGAACKWASIAGLYSEFVAGVLGVLSIFIGGNAATRYGATKHVATQLAANEKAPSAPVEKLPK